MRQHQVLLVADPRLVEGVSFGDISHRLHLAVGNVAGRLADILQRDGDGGVIGMAMRRDVLGEPFGEAPGIEPGQPHRFVAFRPVGQRRRLEIGVDRVDVGLRQLEVAVLERLPLGLDLPGEILRAQFVDEDLDTRLPLVVAAAVQIVHAHDRGDVGEQIAARQEIPDLLGEKRRTALAAADPDGETELALCVLLEVQADIVGLDRRAVAFRAGQRDLELARQIGEFRMHRRPLPEDLGIGARIGHLVGGGACEMVGADVADAVAAGLQRMHLDRGEIGERGRNLRQRRPMELHVLARGEMAVALAVLAADMRQHPELARRQRAIGNGDTQHIGVKLEIDAVHQPERPELLLGDLAGEPALDLVAELGDAGADKLVVELIVTVHARLSGVVSGGPPLPATRRGRAPVCQDRCGRWGRRRGCARAGAAGGSSRRPVRRR